MFADFSQLSVDDLENIINRAKTLVEVKLDDDIKNGYAQIEAIAAGLNMSLDELVEAGRTFRTRRSSKVRKPVKARYRNPQNPSEAWTGRGKPPRWLAAKIRAGAKKEEFLI